VNGRVVIHVLRTDLALTVLVSLQPISARCSRDADALISECRHVRRILVGVNAPLPPEAKKILKI